MISEELLKRVMNLKRIDDIYVEDNLLYFCELNRGINVYELAHKCKEWAWNNGYMLNTVILRADMQTWYCEDDYRTTRSTWKAKTEVEAIFKACEWILKEMNDKQRIIKFCVGSKFTRG